MAKRKTRTAWNLESKLLLCKQSGNPGRLAPLFSSFVLLFPQMLSWFRLFGVFAFQLFNGRFTSVLGACSLFGAPLALSGWFYVVCAAHLTAIVVIVLVVCGIGCSLSPSHSGKMCVFRSVRVVHWFPN